MIHETSFFLVLISYHHYFHYLLKGPPLKCQFYIMSFSSDLVCN
jgi:hypothetical protein